MDWWLRVLLSIEALIFITLFVLLIYLAVRRIKIKQTENFEQREN